ncbi:MAG: N-acetyl-1-D-myo-inositol-2-amino-2-deoxy-alpha-D-glucopyranoside deacetylase [Candidatus Tectimicrobiota bacterium]
MAERLTLMAVHAHPDDECMSTGGVMARYAREGVRTVLVTATRGEEGEVLDPAMNPEEVKPKLGDVRVAELECACRHLGIEELHVLGYRDSGMIGWEANNHPECLHQADLYEATGRVVRLIRTIRPHVLTCYDEQGGYGHPDHIQVHRMTVAAFHAAGDASQYPELGLPSWQPQKLYYTAYPRSYIFMRYELMRSIGVPVPADRPDFDPNKVGGIPDEAITTHVDVQDFILQKTEALRCHRTQIAPDWWFMRIPQDVLRAKFRMECFIRVASHVPIEGHEDDLFAGLR